jgi:hypothetical protein
MEEHKKRAAIELGGAPFCVWQFVKRRKGSCGMDLKQNY